MPCPPHAGHPGRTRHHSALRRRLNRTLPPLPGCSPPGGLTAPTEAGVCSSSFGLSCQEPQTEGRRMHTRTNFWPLWSSSAGAQLRRHQVGLEGIPPLLLGRCASSGWFSAILLVPRPTMPWRWLLAYGGAISLGQFSFLFCAMKFGMPAGMASLVLQSQVVFTLLFAMIWLGERWQPHHWVALPLAGPDLSHRHPWRRQPHPARLRADPLCGRLLGLGNVINRQIGLRYQTTLPSLIAWGGLVPILPFFALSWLFEGPELMASSLLNISWQGFPACSISFVATWLGYGLWGRLLMRYPVAQVAPSPCWCPASAWWPRPCCWTSTPPLAVAGLGPGAAGIRGASAGRPAALVQAAGRLILICPPPLTRAGKLSMMSQPPSGLEPPASGLQDAAIRRAGHAIDLHRQPHIIPRLLRTSAIALTLCLSHYGWAPPCRPV